MRVYHGSDVRIEKIALDKSGVFKDFGRGFYVTTIREHAFRRAVDVAAKHGSKPVVTEFEYLEHYPATMHMNVKRFEKASVEWVQFVTMNRNRNIIHPAHTWDIVEGPVANDWITTQIKRYQKGKITMEQLLEKITYREQTHQICFCTPVSLWALELVDDNARFEVEDISNSIVEALIVDGKTDPLTALKRFHASRTYAQLANPDTGLYTHTWEDVYALLKQEFDKHPAKHS